MPLDRLDDYLPAWREVAAAARELGGRAWLFRVAGHEDRLVEFIEWTGDMALSRHEPLPVLRAALDACGTAHDEPLEEAT